MDMRETRISGEYFFEGCIMKARVDEVRLRTESRRRARCASMLAAWVCCPSIRTAISSSCASSATRSTRKRSKCRPERWDHGPENAEECGVRELAEETGCTAGRIVPLGAMYPSPGFLTEVTYPVRGARPDRGRDASGRGRIRRDRPACRSRRWSG